MVNVINHSMHSSIPFAATVVSVLLVFDCGTISCTDDDGRSELSVIVRHESIKTNEVKNTTQHSKFSMSN